MEYGRVIGTPVYDRLCKDGFIYVDNTIPDFFRKMKLDRNE